MTSTQLTWIRTVSSALITGLAVIYSLYPSYTWITAVIAASATLGIHAIPSVGQKTTGGNTMTSENPETGQFLMGVTPVNPVQTSQTTDNLAVQPVEAPQAYFMPANPVDNTLPDAPVQERTAPVDSPVQTVASRLRAIADELEAL
jgi:hypothetical protein